MNKFILLIFIACSLNLFSEEKQVVFHYKPDQLIFWGEGEMYQNHVVSESGDVFVCNIKNSEIPYENERFIFPKFDDHRCHDFSLHAFAIDEFNQPTGKEIVFHFNNDLLHFLQNNVWEMDWGKINILKEMATFEFSSDKSSTIAKNKYCKFFISSKAFVTRKGRFITVNSYDSRWSGMVYLAWEGNHASVMLPSLFSNEMIEYVNGVINDLEVELGSIEMTDWGDRILLRLYGDMW